MNAKSCRCAGAAWFAAFLTALNTATAQLPPNAQVDLDAWATPPVAVITPEAKPVYAAAIADLKATQDGLISIRRAQSANKMGALAPGVFTKVNSALTGLNWRSRFLLERGEPCGAELSQRAGSLRTEFHYLAGIYRNGPKAQAFNNKATEKYTANVRKREAAYRKAAELAMRGKMEECEQFVLATYQQWFLDIGLIHNVGGYTKGFATALNTARTAMAAQRRTEGAAALLKLRQSLLPNVNETLAATQKIVDDIKQSGTATVGGTSVDGPKAFDQVARFWKITHWNLHKAEAAEMARCGLAQKELPDLARIRSEHQKLTDGMSDALAEIISGDTTRATQETLDRYLQSAANLRADCQARTLAKVDRALGAMAVKLHGDTIADLNLALNDLLRWRGKSADARAAALQKSGYDDTQQAIIAAARSTKTMRGIISQSGTEDNLPRFLGSAPEIVTLGEAPGRKVSLWFVAPSTPTATVRISQLHNGVFATMPATWDSAASITQLKSDLLITDQLPALTLNAASSIEMADAGAFRRMGGTVKAAYPKSLIVEKVALPAASWNMLPLGPLEALDTTQWLPQAVMHIDVTPAWFQHEHFLAPAKQPSPAAAGG